VKQVTAFDLSVLCSEHGLRECGEVVRDCPAYVARIEGETREAVAEWWPESAVDWVSAHMLALMWGESRLNRCGVGPGGRKVLGMKGKNPHRYTESELRGYLKALRSSSRVDLGPGQILWRYARSPNGRRATVDEMIGADAVRVVAYNLHLRKRGNRDPWGYWPGVKYNETYVRKVARIAAKLMRGKP